MMTAFFEGTLGAALRYGLGAVAAMIFLGLALGIILHVCSGVEELRKPREHYGLSGGPWDSFWTEIFYAFLFAVGAYFVGILAIWLLFMKP